MQYDLKKELEDKSLVSLTWHGVDTMVKLSKEDAGKTEVKTGASVDVSVSMAKFLLGYSDLWTMKGDKPTAQPWREAQKAAAKLKDSKKAQPKKDEEPEEGDDDVRDLSPEGIAKMDKKELKEALTVLEVEFKAKATSPELKELLLSEVEGVSEGDDEPEEGDDEVEEGNDEVTA